MFALHNSMGAAASLSASSSPEEVAAAAARLGQAYEPFSKAVVDHGVNGELLLAAPQVDAILTDLGVEKTVDRARLKLEIDKLRTPRQSKGKLMNSAFVFIKPHANNAKVQAMVKASLLARGIHILQEGDFSGPEIDEKRLIDQHYYAIASKATLLQPKDMAVPSDKFQESFGLPWEQALQENRVFNALDAAKALGLDAQGLDALWSAGKKVKFGGGFYCADLQHQGQTYYTFNAFFMTMRGKFVAPQASIHYFAVSFDWEQLSWKDFRGTVLGPTDPAAAPADSLRGRLFAEWQAFGLEHQPTTGDNCVHASASPFEGLAERMNWLGVQPAEDPFGAACLRAGLSAETLRAWSVDPQVKGRSVFDQLEDSDAPVCLERLEALSH